MFDKSLQAIQESKTAIETQLFAIWEEAGLLRADHAELVERLNETAHSLMALRASLFTMQEQIKALQGEAQTLLVRAEHVEGCYCCNNICFLSFPEGPGVPPAPGGTTMLNHCTSTLLLQSSRSKAPQAINGTDIMAYPAYMAEVQRKHGTSEAVKAQLYTLGLAYALLFPMLLRVVSAGTTHFFTLPEEAWSWLHTKGITEQPLPQGDDQQGWSDGRPQQPRHPCKQKTHPTEERVALE
ncbi:hypothetical protein NDU88_008059 [Pleurodeles waltl]|uniref:Uncharacterized protein n=1 Tax=Pleurodeles waltl TaxID=8319 RepID=A0AAV7QQS5_PLEWA|nr:hypothetical protein NDU88_008059 [Pleurodeles waltl]